MDIDISNEELFKFWIEQGWKYRRQYNKRMYSHTQEYKDRLKHEVKIISERDGFIDYFLMVSDIVRWAKSKGIGVGPGRGSSAASLVCYLIRITEIDPMPFPMLFERFLDPTRTDPPDIDVDFDDQRREEVFQYARDKYGLDKAANICTFTRYKGRNSLDDVARVYHISSWKIENIKGKLYDRSEGHPRFANTIEDTRSTFTDIAEIFESDPRLNYASDLEGNIRNDSIHASGMAICSEPLAKYTAIYQREDKEDNGEIRTSIAYDKRDAVYLGLLKMDFLGLKTMGMIAEVCDLAGIKLEELYRIPLDDKKTLENFAKGEVLGIFQFEGNTTRRILKKVKPEHFMHLADINALSRPGANDKGYIFNKNTGELPEFAHDIIRQHTTIWPNTYGEIVYEEQILMILRDLGGFEPSELNKMRKIIHDKMGSTSFNEYYKRFLEGCYQNGLHNDKADKVWNTLTGASGYAFNIAHSVCYGHIGYWANYLKTHHTKEFYPPQLNRALDESRRGKLIAEAERSGIRVKPPVLLDSGRKWALVKGENPYVAAGFEAIKGIGPAKADAIIAWRDNMKDDRGLDWEDLSQIKGVGPKTIKTIKDFVNADDPFGVHETSRILNKVRYNINNGQLIGVPEPTHVSIDIPKDRELVTYIGLLRGKKYYDAIEQLKKRTKEDISVEDALLEIKDNHFLKYVCLMTEDDYGEQVKVWCWRQIYPKYKETITKAKANKDVIIVQGYSSDFGGTSVQVKEMWILDPYKEG